MRLLYCAGEQARVVIEILRRNGAIDDVVVVDDDPDRHGEQVGGAEIVGGEAVLNTLDTDRDRAIVAFGAKRGVRLELAERIRGYGLGFFNAIDPEATVSSSVRLGTGCTVNARTYLGPDVAIDDHVLVDSAVNVSHDTTIEAGATVAPNATLTGGVTVERDAFIGAGATVRDHITVGKRAVVGAGAVVVDDVPPDSTVVGVPAKPLRKG